MVLRGAECVRGEGRRIAVGLNVPTATCVATTVQVVAELG